MTGAMYAAVAGLKTHMSKLNVIGNNVSNVNTYGYKAATTTFRESLYSIATAGSNGGASMGGLNPSQYGYGCSVGTIDLDMSTKNFVPTGKPMDTMINGEGFFLVGQKMTNPTIDQMMFTRVGDLEFDSQGYLVDGSGYVVYGFSPTAKGATITDDPTIGTDLSAIRLPMCKKDANGVVESWDYGSAGGTEVLPLESITIDPNTGKITGSIKDKGETVVIGYIALGQADNTNGLTHINGPYYKALEGAGNSWASTIGGGVAGVPSAGATKLVTSGLESSGTDLATEFSEMISTQRGYQANTRIVTVTDSMLEELVNMKR